MPLHIACPDRLPIEALLLRAGSPPSVVPQPIVSCVDFFFFQAEDGIRDDLVTGVQTCALPILSAAFNSSGSIFKSCANFSARYFWTVSRFSAGVSSTLRRSSCNDAGS